MSRIISLRLFALAGLSIVLTAYQARAATISIEDSPLDFEAQRRCGASVPAARVEEQEVEFLHGSMIFS